MKSWLSLASVCATASDVTSFFSECIASLYSLTRSLVMAVAELVFLEGRPMYEQDPSCSKLRVSNSCSANVSTISDTDGSHKLQFSWYPLRPYLVHGGHPYFVYYGRAVWEHWACQLLMFRLRRSMNLVSCLLCCDGTSPKSALPPLGDRFKEQTWALRLCRCTPVFSKRKTWLSSPRDLEDGHES